VIQRRIALVRIRMSRSGERSPDESRLSVEACTLQLGRAVHRWTIAASMLTMTVAGGCATKLDSHAADGAADTAADTANPNNPADASDAADSNEMSDRPDAIGTNDAADGPACTGTARQDCIVDQCNLSPQYTRVCQNGVWVCPAPYQPLPPEVCCARKVCLQNDGSLTSQTCSAGIAYCPPGTTEVKPGTDASADPCAAATTEAACNDMSDCHAVYTAEPRTPVGSCTCPDFGCCTRFSFCAFGSRAMCTSNVSCSSAPPYCEPGYSAANDFSCYLGCVKSSICSS